MTARRLLPSSLLALLLAFAPAAGAGAVVLPAGTTAVISGAPDLLTPLPWPMAFSQATGHALDARGDEVAFTSTSDGLLAGDDDTVSNVYVKDLSPAGGVQLASVATDGRPSHVNCHDAVLSANGNAVAFACEGPLDPAAAPGVSEVYERDLVHGTTTLVSRAPGGAAGNGPSSAPAIDADGGVVAFQSHASNLGAPPDGVQRILRWSIDAQGVTQLQVASLTTAGQPSLDDAQNPTISDDGKRIAFDTSAQLDPTADADLTADVYVRDLRPAQPQTVLASVPGPGGSSDFPVTGPMISGDGSAVALSTSGGLLAADTDGNADVYLRTLGSSATTTGVSFTATVNADADATLSSIDGDGRVVEFKSFASNLGVPAPRTSQVYVNHDGQISLASRHDGPDGAPLDEDEGDAALSGDGARTTLTVGDGGSVLLRDLAPPDHTRAVSVPPPGVPFDDQGGGFGGAVSADGRFVAFATAWPGFGVPAGGDGIVVRDLETGAVTLASRADGPQGASLAGPLDSFQEPRISAGGSRVAFTLLHGDGRPSQVYVREIATGRTFLVSAALGGGPGNGASDDATISDDGRRVAFRSGASDLSADDGDPIRDVFVRDVDAGQTLLADRADGTSAKATDGPSGPVISGDGHRVAFASRDRLAATDTHGVGNVYVRDLDHPGTQLASIGPGGAVDDMGSGTPSLSRDGSRVAFVSGATTFGVPGPSASRLYVRDLAAGTTTVAGRADGRDGAVAEGISGAQLSADGDHAAFAAAPAASIAPGAPADDVERVYERDLSRGVTRLISRGPAPDGAALGAGGVVRVGGITADGGCVTFDARGALFPPPASVDVENVYLRTVEFNCGRPVPVPPLPGPGGGGGSTPAVLSRLSVKPARFFVVVRGVRGGGTRVAFRLDKASSVALVFDRLLAGRRKGKRCLTTVHRGRRCTVVRRAGRLTLAHARAGANTLKFAGRLGRHVLVPGRYRLTATPLHGRARTARLVVVKAPRARR